ncbi:TonB-dependent receptor [Sphingobacterium chuzhouense]|uniref:TonB-dependent receptor n=1 Tax=Sphingobacterium chuzhouense TaxID=1742264 RepID=A0ABR7XNR5_9SPHI|nr:TonB-dependent receptor [Sphingobacterium chuzhouense]MBD1420821.1 TonB-dependent receptor [Sphingobacterium chuzhouense]
MNKNFVKNTWASVLLPKFTSVRPYIFVLFTVVFVLSAQAKAQMISLVVNNARVETLLQQITDKYSLHFLYADGLLASLKPVSIDVRNQPIDQVLQNVFKDTGIRYTKRGNNITLLKTRGQIKQDNIQVTGSVTDSTGAIIAGASVALKSRPEVGTLTDKNGKFILEVPRNSIIVVSYIGFSSREILVNAPGTYTVILETDATGVEEVVVVGYGKQKKAEVVSAISSVDGKSLQFATRSLSNNLAGQVSGLIAIQRSGEPGYDNSEFWIRGVSTFAGGTSPLVLVDGIPRSINDIEPEEIETFSVLKDAAATAVYGAEGANGVVIITSKRGRIAKPVISFRTEHSLSQPTRLPQFVNSADYLTLFNEALRNDGELPIYSDELIANYRNNIDPDLYPNTNWMDALLRDLTRNQRYTLNARGGTERTRYFVSGAYFAESGIFKDDPNNRYDTNIGVKRFNLRSNIDIDVTKTTMVSVDLSGQYLVNNYPGTGTGTIFRQMLITPPYVFPPIYSDGTIATFPQERDANMRNPYNMLMNSGYAKEWRSRIQSAVRLDQKLDVITNGLSYRGIISYDYDGDFSSRRTYDPSRYFATGRDEAGNLIFTRTFSGTEDMSEPVEGSSAVKHIYMESSLNYNNVFDRHTVGAMALFMQKESQYHNEALAFRKQGIVGRATYSYDGRYFIEGNFGYTGSETFAKGYRFGFFPALGVSYQLSNESFYPDAIKNYLTSVRFRVSMGRTGNDNTGGERFLYRPTFNMGAGGFNQGITNGGGSNGLGAGIVEGRFEAPYLSWEIEDKQNYGINLGLFNNRIEIVADYFKSERTGILLTRRTIPASVGFRAAPWENYGKVENWGVDGSINATHQAGAFNIGLRGTFTFARNKITEYDELPQPYPWMAWTGSRVSENTLFIAERLYTDNDFNITENPNGTKSYQLKEGIPTPTLGGRIGPGDIKYVDLNGDGLIDAFDQQRGVGNPATPEIVYGFGMNLEYKNFYISSFFQGVGNTSVLFGGNTPEGWYPFSWGVDQSNYRTFALDRWTEENPTDNVLMPRIHSSNTNSANNNRASTWWLRNGRFLRLKNVEIGYNMPKPLLERIKIQSARIYAMGHNLAVWDEIKHWDPETGNSNGGLNYPLPRMFTFGLEFTF